LEGIDPLLGISASGVVIRRASSKIGIKELLVKMRERSGSSHVVQLFDPKMIINRTHLVSAYLNALLAFSSKSNISNSVAVEMVLYAALTRQINEAISAVGAKSEKDFIVFAESKAAYSKISGLISNDSDFAPSPAHMRSAAKALNMKVRLDDLSIMQEIAIARLGQ